MKRLAFVMIAAAGLAACGKIAPLTPPPGQSLPVKPRMAAATPTAEELLALQPIAAPERIDELMRRSESRKSDRFDLPPPDGGAAPAPEVEPANSSEEAGPATPQ